MNKFTILLIDDVEENLYSLKLLIEDRFDNLEIMSALNVKDALLIIMKYEIDLILSDVQMPEINGFELIEYLGNIEQTKDIPVMLITGICDDERFVKQAYNTGAIEYISKPIDDNLLYSKLRVFLKIFMQKKEDKQLIAQKDKLLLNQIKINAMMEHMDKFSPKIQKSIFNLEEHENKNSEDIKKIDMVEILKNI